MRFEEEVRKFWEENDIRKKLEALRAKEHIGVAGFVEGPPTLNGVPHVGHARGRTIKDLYYRYLSMKGYYMPFWAGWDCQGLPVELEAEKLLGVRGGKRELLAEVGMERFVEECKKTLFRYYPEWLKADRLLGVFMNHEKAYWTYRDEYIEREWAYLRAAWERGLLAEDYYVVAYCPYCQTSLSHAEVGLGYEVVEDPSVFFKLRLRDRPGEFLLVWTTMPFTIITDLMVAVHPEADYARVRVGDEVWVLATQRVEPVMEELGIEDYEVVDVVPGSALEGLRYEYPFYDLVPRQAEFERENPLVHTVVCEDFVDVSVATGVVHLSPGNGEEDFQAARKRGVPVFSPFDDACVFTEEAGRFSGLFARDADEVVIRELAARGLLVKAGKVKHEYPTCWRSHHKLVWVARREYFYRVDRLREEAIKAAEAVEYFYEPPKHRFLSFIKEARPWCISRERVWGTPLPIWACPSCGHKELVSSKEELLRKASKLPGHLELHRPWIDEVVLRCPNCGGEMRREPFVLDCWHNSGVAPYARFSDEEFEEFVPVFFLVEGIDQTRGWAYSLLMAHLLLTGRAEAPYKAFLFYGIVLDERGRKMSKSLGNVVLVNPFLEKHPADLFRFYMLWKCAPIDDMRFDVKEMYKRPYQVLSTLYHLHRFFYQNATYDGFDPTRHTLDWALGEGLLKAPDRWVLSRLQALIAEVDEGYARCRFHKALQALEEFVIEVLSHWYVPMVRRELWTDDPRTLPRRLAIYATLWHVLKTLLLLFNPATPFLAEWLYQHALRALDASLPESVNFERWPEPDPRLRDVELEKAIERLTLAVSLAHSARQKAGLKRR
ncbi:MAG TPA: isoleucine--tRNA ligase, partial [Candidatus Bathyarchaeota archaeon]|nr:isoleucine--tRNA ligase [Candidatus Bathyarchaeota archaeon]